MCKGKPVPVHNPYGKCVRFVNVYTLVWDGHRTRHCKVVERQCHMKTPTRINIEPEEFLKVYS